MAERIRVVVAEADPVYREGILAALRAADMQVLGHADTREGAVRLAREHRPDVVLIDVDISGGGLHAVRQLVAHLDSTRVVLLTAAETTDDLLEAFKAGVSGYALKKVSAEELVDIVRAVVAGQAYAPPRLAWALVARQAEMPSEPEDGLGRLSARERQVLALVGSGLTNRDIAERLGLAEKTVKTHMTSIMKKLHVRSRVSVAVLARRAGLSP